MSIIGDQLARYRMSKAGLIPPDAWNSVLDVLRCCIPRKGNGYTVKSSVAGWTLDIFNATNKEADHPFKVYIRSNPDNPALYQARVSYNSSLLKSIRPDDKQEITGLSSEANDGNSDEDWFPFDSGDDFIWLEISLNDDYSVASATISSWGQGSDPNWTPSKNPGEDDGPFTYSVDYDDYDNAIFTQKKARLQIFQSNTLIDGSISNRQLLNSHLLMISETYYGDTDDGKASIYTVRPTPYAGPYIS